MLFLVSVKCVFVMVSLMVLCLYVRYLCVSGVCGMLVMCAFGGSIMCLRSRFGSGLGRSLWIVICLCWWFGSLLVRSNRVICGGAVSSLLSWISSAFVIFMSMVSVGGFEVCLCRVWDVG